MRSPLQFSISSIFFTTCILGLMLSASAQIPVKPDSGNGTSTNPFRVATFEHLLWISTYNDSWDKAYILTCDIDMKTTSSLSGGWQPIGNYTAKHFTGTFDGNGYTLKNLYINRATSDFIGLFGSVARPGTVQNLHLDSATVSGAKATGSLIGICVGATITNCGSTNCSVTGRTCVGGLVGWLECGNGDCAHLVTSLATGTVTASSSSVGGLTGWVNGYVYDSYAMVKVSGSSRCGGLIGFIIGGAVERSYSTGTVSGTSETGGLAGNVESAGVGSVSSYWDSQTSAIAASARGTGKTSQEMKTQSTFTDWDFAGKWAMINGVNSGYPILRWTAKSTICTGNLKGAIDSTRRMSEVLAVGELGKSILNLPAIVGFCYGQSPSPDISGSKVSTGSPLVNGRFSLKIPFGGTDTTRYFVRAYATNTIGTWYGQDMVFMRGVPGYHWQPSKSLKPLMEAGSLDTNNTIQLTGTRVLKSADSVLWLDTVAGNKRYSMDLYKAKKVTVSSLLGSLVMYTVPFAQIAFTNDRGMMNQTFYCVTRGAFSMFDITLFKSYTQAVHASVSYANDSIMLSGGPGMSTKKTVACQLGKAISEKSWIPYFIHIRNLSPDSVRVSFGYTNQEMGSISFACTTGTFMPIPMITCDITSLDTAAELADIHLFSSYDSTGINGIWSPYFSPSYENIGPVQRIPVSIHNILYDPPGSESYSTCIFDTSLVTRWNFNWGVNAGGSLEMGLMANISAGIALGVDLTTSFEKQNTVRAEVHYSYDHNWGGETSISKSTQSSSMTDNSDSALIGPAGGDVIVYQDFAYRNVMMRRPKMNRFRSASKPEDYTYATAGGVPVPDSCGPVYYKPIQTVVRDFSNSPQALAILKDAYPFDLITGKVRPEMLDSLVDPVTHEKNPPRLQKLTDEKEITGNQVITGSETREDIVTSDTTHSWGGSINYTDAVWAVIGYELNVYGGCDFAHYRSASDGNGSTISYTLQDNDSWDRLRITPYKDLRFKTVCFLIDSANSYTSFPHEANTRPAVSWEVAPVAALNGYVGQTASMKVKVKNTSPKSILPSLPSTFTFTVSAVNFPGTFYVVPEAAEIAVGQEIEFTVDFTGSQADSFLQSLKVTCWAKDNFHYMDQTIQVPMVLSDADVGLIAQAFKDTLTVPKGSVVSGLFTVKLQNTGSLPAIISFGTDSLSAGATVSFGTLTNPLSASDSTTLAVTLNGDGTRDFYTLYYWTQIDGAPVTKSHHALVLSVTPQVAVFPGLAGEVRELGITGQGRGLLTLLVPKDEKPVLKIYTVSGQMIYTCKPSAGRSSLDVSSLSLPCGYYIIRMQGTKLVQRKMIVSGR
ncbi:MAG TPA: hypothetical protein VHO70_18480 [Chitinispirillaceae bacterium]|nr:hypothetical protein [Chitinispirillaceae bacterium]